MKCPVCKDVTLLMSEKHGIEVDYCPECRGIWLDRGELDKIIQRAQKDLNEEENSFRRSRDDDWDEDDRRRKYNRDDDYDRKYSQKPKKRRSAMLGDLLEIFGGDD